MAKKNYFAETIGKEMDKMNQKWTLRMTTVLLDEGSCHLLVEAHFPGLDNCWWVVDTGAALSVLDKSLAGFLNGGETTGSMATGLGKDPVATTKGILDCFCLDGHKLDPLEVVVVDLHHINAEYARYTDKRVAGLLGSDFFLREHAILDCSSGTIHIRQGSG
ncbi:MAG: retropepsin-like domain-containing protein, partial [Marinilabiliales bacterium]|nr:retropepsin-like domain-containing protein [Marinilabiliales bacterium]